MKCYILTVLSNFCQIVRLITVIACESWQLEAPLGSVCLPRNVGACSCMNYR